MEMFDMWQRTALLLCLLPAALVARQTIHVVFSCHLVRRARNCSRELAITDIFLDWFETTQDIGFDGITPYVGFDNTVINTYFDVYFPKAVCWTHWERGACPHDRCSPPFPQIRVAEELRQRGGHQHLKFMTHVCRWGGCCCQ